MDIIATFPKRLFISLDRRADRRAKLLPRLAAAGLTAESLEAIDGRLLKHARGFMSLSKRANALSKRLAIRAACLAGAEAVLIFEDDVMFHPQFAERVSALTLPADWGMFYFGCLHREPPQRVGPGIVRASRCFDHHAFAIRREYFHTVRKTMRGWGKKANGRLHSDVLVSDLHKTIPTYAAYPNLAWQAEDFSDLADRSYSNYRPDGTQKLWGGMLAHL